MRKYTCLIAVLFLGVLAGAETVKLKDGSFVSGSITNQTQYTINMSTSYGPIILNQKEVEAILPDQHRIHLKGGTQLVGVILDLDEFNLKLQTDEGVVNIDMPQIVSIEVYDHEQGSEMQKNIEQRQAAAQAQQEALAATTAAAATGTVAADTATGGLNFDDDIEKVFDAQKPDIVNGQVQTVKEISAADIRAQRAAQQLSEEEAFLKGSSAQTIEQQAQDARSGKLAKAQKTEAKKAARPKEITTNKYFTLAIGAQTNDLKLDNSKQAGFEGTDPYDVGGTSVHLEGAFLWRVKNSNLWAGPALALANISKNSFTDLDPNVVNGNNQSMIDHGYLAYDPDVSTNGQMIDLMARADYFFNPKSLFVVYTTVSGGIRFLTLNYHGGIRGTNISASVPFGKAGIGVQTYWDDLLIGLEVTEHFASYSGKFKKSSGTSTTASLTFGWKF